MPTIVSRRQGGVLIEAILLPAMCSMIRSQFPAGTPPVEQHWSYPDTPHGTENAMRHWDSLANQMRDEVRRSGVSCRIDHWRNPDKAEYVLGHDMEPPLRVIDVGDCHMPDDSIPL